MELQDVIKGRYSMRQFKKTAVPQKLIKGLIELCKLAPSAGNLQAYKVVISKDKVTSYEAPLSLVICAEPEKSAERYGQRGRNLYAIQDATIFASYLQLAIVDAGLASVWVGAFNEKAIINLLNIPEKLKPIAIIALGYPAVKKSGRRRRSYEEIVLSRTKS
jgi:nitroreductase